MEVQTDSSVLRSRVSMLDARVDALTAEVKRTSGQLIALRKSAIESAVFFKRVSLLTIAGLIAMAILLAI